MLLVYMAAMLAITRLGRKVLMDGECASTTYTVLLCVTWLVASFAGVYLCAGLAPFPPHGTQVFPALLILGMACVVFRNGRQLPHQQSVGATLAVYATLVLGTVGGLYLRHAV